MNLRNLSDESLVEKTESLAKEECRLLTVVLHHLREIDQRRLYSAYGFKSLHQMAVERFGYSDDAAYRRIAAMRILKIMPEVEEKIQTGEINITHLSMAQKHFNQEKKHRNAELPLEEKKEFVAELVGKSARETEKVVIKHSSVPKEVKPDKIFQVTEDLEDFHFTAPVGSRQKLELLQDWLAHRTLSVGEVFRLLLDLGIQEWEPGKNATLLKRRGNSQKKKIGAAKTTEKKTECTQKKVKASSRNEEVGSSQKKVTAPSRNEEVGSSQKKVKASSRNEEMKSSQKEEGKPLSKSGSQTEKEEHEVFALRTKQDSIDPSVVRPTPQKTNQLKGVPGKRKLAQGTPVKACVKRAVLRKAKGRCLLCHSTRAPQVDHVIPRAQGGSSAEENLRALCRHCNQRAAIEKMGRETMDPFLN